VFRDLVPGPLPYAAPWTAPLAERLADLRRGTTRVAWLYERPDTSTFRYRCFNPPRTLLAADAGVGAAWFELDDLPALLPELPGLAALVICRVRYDAAVARLVARAKAAGVRVLFDCDDLVFDTRHVHLLLDTLDQDTSIAAAWETWFALIGRLEATARLCEGGITTNAFLADPLSEALGGAPVAILPNYFEREQQAVSRRLLDAKRERGFAGDGPVTIGYFSGTPTHNKDFAVAAPALARLLAADPEVRLRIVGFPPTEGPLAPFGRRMEIIPLQDHLNLQRVIAEVEVNIAPLQDNLFTNCKSELKFFEAAAVGTWTVATPTFTFRGAIRDGETGRLARAHEWDAALAEALALVRDPHRYAPIAEAAAAEVHARYAWDRPVDEVLAAVLPSGAAPRPALPRPAPPPRRPAPRPPAPSAPPPRDRAARLLGGIPRDAAVVEVGASYAPLAAKRDGWRTTVVDHDTAEALRRKYDGAAVDRDRIEEVDAVWRDGPLHAALPPERLGTYGALIASHVLEHIPDPVAFLLSADRLLAPGGVVVVAVPDKRFCFDAHRAPSTAGAMLQAHLEGRTRHTPGTLFDEVALSVTRDGRPGWPHRYAGGPPRLFHPEGLARQVFDAARRPDAAYADCHAWQFTPASLELLLLDLRLAGAQPWEIDWIEPRSEPTGEILARLRRADGDATGAATGAAPDPGALRARREALLAAMQREAAEGAAALA